MKTTRRRGGTSAGEVKAASRVGAEVLGIGIEHLRPRDVLRPRLLPSSILHSSSPRRIPHSPHNPSQS